MKDDTSGKTNTLQTLDRGLQVLDLVCGHAEGLSVAAIAQALGVHRAIAYRLVSTLEQRGLVVRGAGGRIVAGPGLMRWGDAFAMQLRAASRPWLAQLAEQAGATAFLSVAQGDECVAVQVHEPQHVDLRLSYRVGSRHPLTSGAPGIAILSARPARADDLEAVRTARAQGYSLTEGEVQAGAIGIACPVRLPEGRDQPGLQASVGVVTMHSLDPGRCIDLVTRCARAIALALQPAAGGSA